MSEQLYVAITEDGSYLKRHIVETHGGNKVRFETVSLNEADVFPIRTWNKLNPPSYTLLPAKVTRVVTLIMKE